MTGPTPQNPPGAPGPIPQPTGNPPGQDFLFAHYRQAQRALESLSGEDFLGTSKTEDRWVWADTGADIGEGPDPVLSQAAGFVGRFVAGFGEHEWRETRLIPGSAAVASKAEAVTAEAQAAVAAFNMWTSMQDYLKEQNKPENGGRATVPLTVPNFVGGFTTFNVSPDTAASIAQRGFEFNESLKFDLMKLNNLSARDVADLEVAIAGENRLSADLAFRIEDAQARLGLAQQQLAIDVQGLQLERAGLQINAIGQDFNRLVQIGQMTHDEAALNLSRIDTALTQRRASREELYRFAVKRSSLIQRDGETVTQLPFSEQIAMSLSGLSGGPIDPEDFELPVGFVDPEAEAAAVLGASDFQSQVPGLQAARQQASTNVDAILGNV